MIEGMRRVLLDGRSPQNEIEDMMHDIRSRMLSIGDNHSRELVNIVFINSLEFMAVSINHPERRTLLEGGLEDYLKYRLADLGFR